MTQPLPGSTIGPTYSDANRLTFVPFTPAQQRQLRGGLSTAKVKSFVPKGFTLDHVGNGGMWLRSTSGTYAPKGPTVAESNKVVAKNKAEAAKTKAQVEQALAGKTFAWVDGQYVTLTPVVDPKTGQVTSYTTAPVGGDPKSGRSLAVPVAFGAIDGGEIDETAPFLMSHFQLGTPGTNSPVTGKPGSGLFGPGGLLGIVHSISTSGQGIMTIGAGVSWLASLATKDPEAYQAMLDKLHNAGYLDDGDYARAAGHWSAEAGKAFALAARDTAAINATAGGANTTLDEFLSSKSGALAAAQAAGKAPYTPAERSYTDPAAIKAAARSQAEQMLGRQLTPEEEDALVSHYRALEDGMWDQVDAAGKQGLNASYTRPDAGGQIDAFLNDPAHEEEANQWRATQFGEALKGLFSQTTRLT